MCGRSLALLTLVDGMEIIITEMAQSHNKFVPNSDGGGRVESGEEKIGFTFLQTVDG